MNILLIPPPSTKTYDDDAPSTQALRDALQGQHAAKLKGRKLNKAVQKLKSDLAKSRAATDCLNKEVRGEMKHVQQQWGSSARSFFLPVE